MKEYGKNFKALAYFDQEIDNGNSGTEDSTVKPAAVTTEYLQGVTSSNIDTIRLYSGTTPRIGYIFDQIIVSQTSIGSGDEP